MSDTNTPATAYLGLGSNLGDRAATMRAAARALDDHPDIHVDFETGVASLYETSPFRGPSSQPAYLNSALRVRTTLSPAKLLQAALSIEAALGRTRRQRWEARLIDIDLLLYDDLAMNDADLSLPHLRLHERRFVLEPLREIAGAVVHPVMRVSIETLTGRLRAARTDGIVERLLGEKWFGHRSAFSPGMGPTRG